MKTSNTPITEESIEQIIESLPSQTEERSQHIRAHIKRVLSDPSYRASFIDLNPPQIIRPVSREEPKADYTDEELISFVLHTKELDNSYVDRIHGHRADAEIRQLIASWKRQHDVRLYRPVSKLRQLHDENDKPGIIDGIRNSLFGELLGRGLIDRASIANVSKAVNIATGKLAGINDTRNDGPLDRPAYHYQLIVPSTKRRIKEIAVAHLINWNVIGNVAALYADVMGVADAAE